MNTATIANHTAGTTTVLKGRSYNAAADQARRAAIELANQIGGHVTGQRTNLIRVFPGTAPVTPAEHQAAFSLAPLATITISR